MQAAQKLTVWRYIVPEQQYQTPKYQLSRTPHRPKLTLNFWGNFGSNSAFEVLTMELTL